MMEDAGLSWLQRFALLAERHRLGLPPRDDREAEMYRRFDQEVAFMAAWREYMAKPIEIQEQEHREWVQQNLAPDFFVLEQWI